MNGNNGSEFANNAPVAGDGAGAGKGKKTVVKRKDIMENIAARSMLSDYNAAVQGKKNEKQLADKVAFFEKKEAAGELKDTFRPKYEEAKRLLSHVRTLRGTPLANHAAVPAVNSLFVDPVVLPAKAAKTPKPKTVKVNKATVPKTPKTKTMKANRATGINVRRLAPIAEHYAANENVNVHLYEASQAAVPLPDLYDPFTGRKFGPEEDKLSPIEDAFLLLKTEMRNIKKKAATLRKRAAKNAAKASGTNKKNGNNKSRRTRRNRRN